MIFIIISFAKRISAEILHFNENLEITRNNRERATSSSEIEVSLVQWRWLTSISAAMTLEPPGQRVLQECWGSAQHWLTSISAAI
jgi:hypothetical protein